MGGSSLRKSREIEYKRHNRDILQCFKLSTHLERQKYKNNIPNSQPKLDMPLFIGLIFLFVFLSFF
jgi:hypothetical protein